MTRTTVRTTTKVTTDGKIAAWAATLAPVVAVVCWLALPLWWAFIAGGVCAAVTIGGVMLFASQRQFTHQVEVTDK